MANGFIRTTGKKNQTNMLLIILIVLTLVGIMADLIVLKEGWRSLFSWLF